MVTVSGFATVSAAPPVLPPVLVSSTVTPTISSATTIIEIKMIRVRFIGTLAHSPMGRMERAAFQGYDSGMLQLA